MTAELAWTLAAGLVMVVGLVGVLVPVLPGLLVVWAAGLGYGLAVGFGWIGWTVLALMTAAVATSLVAGVLVPKRAADGAGVSGWSQVAAVAGALIGLFTIPLIGLPVGALAGVVAVEYGTKRNWPEAWRATRAVAVGFGLSALIDLALGTVMVAAWTVWALTVLVSS